MISKMLKLQEISLDELFMDTSSGKEVVVTRNGVRVNKSVSDILKEEREKPDFKQLLENMADID